MRSNDDAEAAKWFTAAANQGYAPAQAKLGELYMAGKGVPQDSKQGYLWLTLATKQDSKDAEKKRDQILRQKKLSFDEITKLESTAAGWKPKLTAPKNASIIQ